ncbi:hypothetical protein V8C35DRAFT_196827 [Trichoderma chlorosporum]
MHEFCRWSLTYHDCNLIRTDTNLSEQNQTEACVCLPGTAREKPDQRATWVGFTSTSSLVCSAYSREARSQGRWRANYGIKVWHLLPLSFRLSSRIYCVLLVSTRFIWPGSLSLRVIQTRLTYTCSYVRTTPTCRLLASNPSCRQGLT